MSHDNVQEMLTEVCEIATRAIPNAEGASLTAFSEAGPGAVAYSDDWAKALDEMQYAEHEGPCLDAARTGLVFRIRDMRDEARWPSYMPRAAEHGALSMVSMPLTSESKTLGALDVYARVPDAFGPVQVSIAEIVAGHASLASQVAATLFRHREVAEQLKDAMLSRATIEQAKGIVMAQQPCTPDQAFTTLVHYSQVENRKLRDVAAALVKDHSGL